MNAIYIHIPFCKKKCAYCDFVSYAGKEEQIDEYVNKIIKEILNSALGIRHSAFNTIFFGGGTPTLLKPRQFEAILKTLTLFPSPSCLPAGKAGRGMSELVEDRVKATEISIEANPGTINKGYLTELKNLGINRLSIGIQSFNDNHLKTLGRIHNSDEAKKAIEDAQEAGFDNINVDLIFAIPNQTLDEWMSDLKKTIELNPTHISTYNLQIEENTLLWHQPNPHPLPSEDLDADMYEFTIDYLKENGFKHYEISNFAKPGYECQHNINYWKNGNYVGIGAGAHSHINGKRWANPDSIEAYLKTMDDRRWTMDDTSITTDKRETIFMGLRLLEGLPVENFNGFERQVENLKDQGLLEESCQKIRLTKKGLFLGNLVFESFV